MDKERCYICETGKPLEWHSMWYDGEQRGICSSECRCKILDLCSKNPKKTYSEQGIEHA